MIDFLSLRSIVENVKSQFYTHKDLGQYLTWNIIYRALVVLISLIAGLIVSREIGDSNRGIYQLFFTSLMLFNAALNFGFNSSASYYANRDIQKVRSYLGNNLLLTVLSTILIAISIIALSSRLHLQSESLKYVFIVCYFSFSFNSIYRAFLIGLHENLYIMKLDFCLRLTYLILIILAQFTQNLTLNVIFSLYTSELLIFCFFSYRKIKVDFFPIKFDLELFRESLYFNLRSYIGYVFVLMIMRSDQYVIKYLLNNANVGIYGVGSTIIENLAIFSSILATVYLPKFIDIKDYNLILQKTKRLLVVIFLSSLGIGLVIYFLAPYIVSFFLKRDDEIGVLSLRILLIGFLFWSMFTLLYSLYLSQRVKKSVIIILGFILLLNLSLNFIFVPIYGILAAASSSSFCYALIFVISYVDLFYLKRRNFDRLQLS